MLTANYMPEYGRASGGQIRFITKSGSNRFTGTAGFYLRDETLQANSWARNRSTNPLDNQGPAPFDYKQYGYSFGGPIAWGDLRNKLFFFGAQEWVDFNQIQTNTATVPTARMRARRLRRAARSGQRVLHRRARDQRSRSAASRSRTTSSRRSGCRRTAWRFSTPTRCRRPASARAPRT